MVFIILLSSSAIYSGSESRLYSTEFPSDSNAVFIVNDAVSALNLTASSDFLAYVN